MPGAQVCSGHLFLSKKGKKAIFRDPFVTTLSARLEELYSLKLSWQPPSPSSPLLLYNVWAMLFLSINEASLFSLNSYSICVCVIFSCLCVGAPTLFLSSCGLLSKLPHSLSQAPKKYWRVLSIDWEVCGVCAKLSIKAWNTMSDWECMHRSKIECEWCMEC